MITIHVVIPLRTTPETRQNYAKNLYWYFLNCGFWGEECLLVPQYRLLGLLMRPPTPRPPPFSPSPCHPLSPSILLTHPTPVNKATDPSPPLCRPNAPRAPHTHTLTNTYVLCIVVGFAIKQASDLRNTLYILGIVHRVSLKQTRIGCRFWCNFSNFDSKTNQSWGNLSLYP